MADQYKDLELVNNIEDQRFELQVEGETAFIEYRPASDHYTLIHTEVPESLGGKGVGTAIIEKALYYLEQHQLKLIPLCPFVLVYLKRHPEWKRILAPGVKNI
ncbi:MAG: GNAT family N-acetyltransferase [Candidatus Pseudobacter hemicellulosilyticus]|uniref:GNAT family N-acetyltransferase n=1 Tax=Candidatus Pseudobacter hemicellulosilyticus TaxID=3121375 RepID=A0AAJ5WU82_9BACT|nr:MAG: GNAT family N-acetyltransferase [Pseudobacter sp.]